jgi:RNA polymerase sigma-70 factor, ECF subfamily
MISPAAAPALLSSADPASPSGGVRREAMTGSAEDAFSAIYDEHVDVVWRSARRLGVSEAHADDVVQQVFLVVHRRLGEFEGRSSHKTWIFSILLHVVREHRRSMRRKSPHWFQWGERVDPDVLTASAPTPLEVVEKNEAMRKLEALLDEIRDHDKRTVFVLAELEGMTANEISEATGLTPQEVYSRLRAARTEFERAAARMRRAEERGIR